MTSISDPQVYREYMEFVERIKVKDPEVYQKLLDTCGVGEDELAEHIRKTFQTKEKA